MDVLIRHNPRLRFTQVGQNLFPNAYHSNGEHKITCIDLGNGREAIPGYYTSVKASAGGLALQVKNKNGAFYKPVSCIDFLSECFGGGRGGGGGGRGGGRGGYGSGRNDSSDLKNGHFWDNSARRSAAEKLLKNLMVKNCYRVIDTVRKCKLNLAGKHTLPK